MAVYVPPDDGPEPIDDGYEPIMVGKQRTDISVLRNVVDLQSDDIRRNIVIRAITVKFWQACIDKVNTPKQRYRVCATGTPGTGKTISTAILIRMLLVEGKTVVYLIKADKEQGFYYEFKPDEEGEKITTSVYLECNDGDDIDSLKERSTYYIVDPGKTKTNYDPIPKFKPKVIIVASPNDVYWTGSMFQKDSGPTYSTTGFFKHFPLWSLQELLRAGKFIDPDLRDDTIELRHYQVGGVPRHIFASEDSFDEKKNIQADALSTLTKAQAIKIARGEMDAVESKTREKPKSALIGYQHSESDNVLFDKKTQEVVAISAVVAETIFTKFMKDLWDEMLERGESGYNVFEAYTRELMIKKTPFRPDGRPCVSQSEKDDDNKDLEEIPLGGCNGTQLVQRDIVECAMGRPQVVFFSVSLRYPLIDFAYQDDRGIIHAFQATTGKKHLCQIELLKALERKVGGGKKLILYYLVPGNRFDNFVTDPPNPVQKGKLQCKVWHVRINRPTDVV